MAFLLKTEPNKYSFDDLERDGETTWDGISNPQALLNLRSMKKGENLVIYHSNVGKAAVGLAKVVSVDAEDPMYADDGEARHGKHDRDDKSDPRAFHDHRQGTHLTSRVQNSVSYPT